MIRKHQFSLFILQIIFPYYFPTFDGRFVVLILRPLKFTFWLENTVQLFCQSAWLDKEQTVVESCTCAESQQSPCLFHSSRSNYQGIPHRGNEAVSVIL